MRLISALVAVAAPLTLVVSSPVAHGAPCPDVELIFARGTSEPAGVGRVGQALADQLTAQLGGRSLGIYGVNYPATYDFLAAAELWLVEVSPPLRALQGERLAAAPLPPARVTEPPARVSVPSMEALELPVSVQLPAPIFFTLSSPAL
jgi:hypothetical protein